MCTVEEKERWIIKGSKVSFDVLPWKMQIRVVATRFSFTIFVRANFALVTHSVLIRSSKIETFLVWRWQPNWPLWPQTKWQKWVSRGDLWWGLWWVLHPQETRQEVPNQSLENGRETETRNDLQRHSWGRFYRSNQNTTSAQKLCSLNVHSGHNFPTMCDGIFINCTIGFFKKSKYASFFIIVCQKIFEGPFLNRCLNFLLDTYRHLPGAHFW